MWTKEDIKGHYGTDLRYILRYTFPKMRYTSRNALHVSLLNNLNGQTTILMFVKAFSPPLSY